MPRVPSTSLTRPCLCSRNAACRRPPRPLLRHVNTSTQSYPAEQVATPASDPRVHVESLDKTLSAHREHNRTRASRYSTSRPYVPSPQSSLNPRPPKKASLHGPRAQESSGPKLDTASQLHSTPKKKAGGDHAKRLQANAGKFANHTFQWKPAVTINTPVTALLPWMRHQEPPKEPYAEAIDLLTKEIKAFELYTSLNPQEQKAADLTLQDLKAVVKGFDQHLEVDVIGSRATDTADALSDLDANVCLPNTPSSAKSKMSPNKILNALESTIRTWQSTHQGQECPIEIIYHVRNAVIPILSCLHRPTGLPIQIQSTPQAFDSTMSVKSFLREFPTLSALFKVLRQTLLVRGLTVGAHGGLTSYPLLNMIVASLRMSEGKTHPDHAGKQLVNFLDMYCEIDLNTTGVSIRPLGYFPKQDPGHAKPSAALLAPTASDAYKDELEGQAVIRQAAKRSRHILAFQDPANPVNNLGRSATRMRDVQETLIRLRYRLQQAIKAWDDKSLPSRHVHGTSRDASLLKVLLEADYRIYERERRALTRLFDRNSSIAEPIAPPIPALGPKRPSRRQMTKPPAKLVDKPSIASSEIAEDRHSSPKIPDTLVAQWADILGDTLHNDEVSKDQQDDDLTDVLENLDGPVLSNVDDGLFLGEENTRRPLSHSTAAQVDPVPLRFGRARPTEEEGHTKPNEAVTDHVKVHGFRHTWTRIKPRA